MMTSVAIMFVSRIIYTENPKIVTREKQNYVGIRTTVDMKGMATVMPNLMPKLHAWMNSHNVKPSGPEFIRFVYIDMAKGLDIEIGMPIAKAVKGEGDVTAGIIPAGRYVSLTHFGNYSGLVAPNAQLQTWAKEKHLGFSMRKGKVGNEFVSRVEFYKTDPQTEPDPNKWETEILYKLAN